MKISEIFNLKKSQYQLDFVDIDPDKDIPLFLDSSLIRSYDADLYQKMTIVMDNFFANLIKLLNDSNIAEARKLFRYFGEVNETHLGLSKNKSNGKGVGEINSEKLLNAIKNNDAMKKGYLRDIEDLRILVDGFDKDYLSDLLTNLLKEYLIEYTIEQCELHNIPLIDSVPTGYYWDANLQKWNNKFSKRLVINKNPVLLVPKIIVNYTLNYSSEQYKQHFVLNFLQDYNIKNNTKLVRYRKKTKEKYVTKKSILENNKIDKQFLTKFTINHLDIFKKFKKYNRNNAIPLNGNLDKEINMNDLCSFLVDSVNDVKTGMADAHKYHDLMLGVFELLFYPNLINPTKEQKINNGHKIIDICFTNISKEGFFKWVRDEIHLKCPYIFIECKNYSNDISNSELDQLIGRFSDNRGKVGIISCRQIQNEKLFIDRCIDTYKDNLGLIIPITDNDIIRCLGKKENAMKEMENVLKEKVKKIILG